MLTKCFRLQFPFQTIFKLIYCITGYTHVRQCIPVISYSVALLLNHSHSANLEITGRLAGWRKCSLILQQCIIIIITIINYY